MLADSGLVVFFYEKMTQWSENPDADRDKTYHSRKR